MPRQHTSFGGSSDIVLPGQYFAPDSQKEADLVKKSTSLPNALTHLSSSLLGASAS